MYGIDYNLQNANWSIARLTTTTETSVDNCKTTLPVELVGHFLRLGRWWSIVRHPKKSEFRIPDHPVTSVKQQIAVFSLVTSPNLTEAHVIACYPTFRGHGC